MNEPSVLDILSGSLTPEERIEMLDRIHRSGRILFSLPLSEDEGPFDGDLRRKFESFPFFRKILLLLKALFSRSGIEAQTRRQLLSDLARRIDTRYPGYIDFRKGVFKAGFKDEILSLKDSAAVLATLLEGVSGADRPSFTALVAGMTLPDLEEKLLKDTDPVRVYEEFPSLNENQLKAELERRTEECFVMMPERDRSGLYDEFKFLEALKKFVSFPFHRMTAQFSPGGTAGTKDLPEPELSRFYELRTYLADLSAVMCGLKPTASSVLIDALFLRYLRRSSEKPGDSVSDRSDDRASGSPISPDPPSADLPASDTKFSEFSRKTDEAFSAIGAFMRNVPLYDLTRLVLEDLSFKPEPCGGGEDWQIVYRQYWKDVLSARISAFLREYRRQEVINNARRFLGDRDLSGLGYFPASVGGSSSGGRCTLCLSFILSFVQHIFNHRINRYLKTMLIDGEFYKDDNRIEFTDSYNILLSLGERIEALDRSFSPSGELGIQLERIGLELIPAVLREKKVLAVRTSGYRSAVQIVQSAINALSSMTRILDGIINGQAGGRYDTLSNLGYLGGKSSGEYIRHLQRILRDMTEAVDLLNALYDLERYD